MNDILKNYYNHEIFKDKEQYKFLPNEIFNYLTVKNNKLYHNKNVEFLNYIPNTPYLRVKSFNNNKKIIHPVNLNDIKAVIKEIKKIEPPEQVKEDNGRFKNFHIYVKNKNEIEWKLLKSFPDKYTRNYFMNTKKYKKLLLSHDYKLVDNPIKIKN